MYFYIIYLNMKGLPIEHAFNYVDGKLIINRLSDGGSVQHAGETQDVLVSIDITGDGTSGRSNVNRDNPIGCYSDENNGAHIILIERVCVRRIISAGVKVDILVPFVQLRSRQGQFAAQLSGMAGVCHLFGLEVNALV